MRALPIPGLKDLRFQGAYLDMESKRNSGGFAARSPSYDSVPE